MYGTSLFASLLRPYGRQTGIAPPSLRRRAHSFPNEGDDVHRRKDIRLPQGVWWLKHANVREEAAYGDTFVIHRSQDSPKELVLAPQEQMTLQVWQPATVERQMIVLRSPYHILPPEFDADAVVVDVEVTEHTALTFAGEGPACEPVHPAPSSRRRTRKVKFTCNRCQTTTEKFINPLAWNHGVVLCRCDGCAVVHIIRDEKGVFSCLKGPVFPQRLDIRIPKGLPQNPSMPDRERDDDDDDTEFWLF